MYFQHINIQQNKMAQSIPIEYEPPLEEARVVVGIGKSINSNDIYTIQF